MKIDEKLTPADLAKPAAHVLHLAGEKARALHRDWDASRGAPVFTAAGKYTARGWTEWTQGFQYGIPILSFDATAEPDLLELGRTGTLKFMAPHVSHVGVHDHGFNNLSTYGNLRRLMREGRIPANDWELAFYELAIKTSGAVQAARWSTCLLPPSPDTPLSPSPGTPGEGRGEGRISSGQPTPIPPNSGYIYSFNGPHSLFIDTLRSLRILALAHQLGHVLMAENDAKISLLDRLLMHGRTTATYNVFFGKARDAYDLPGRVAHEAIFNPNDGRFRCPNSQQGFSPFSTWTRGLAWAILGFSEQLEFLREINSPEKSFQHAAIATADFYIDRATASDGIPYWDTGAPDLYRLGDWQSRPADPFNDHEPVDSSAAAVAAQGLLRLGKYLGPAGKKYLSAGLTVAKTLFTAGYLAESPGHHGLVLHSIYHRPNGWDYVPPNRKIPCGESSLWGDYHAAELALYLHRLDAGKKYLAFFDSKD